MSQLITEMPEGFKMYVKRPIPVKAIRMQLPFMVDSLEGRLQGDPGDWLVEGIKGELYICRADIFEESYVEAVKK